MNLLTAAYYEEKKIYLTLINYMSAAIQRTDMRYDDYSYVMLTPMGNYYVGCYEKAGEYTGIFSPLPEYISNEQILEIMNYYSSNISKRIEMESEEKKNYDLEGMSFTEWYLKKHYFSKYDVL